MIKHSQSTQSNKFTVSLRNLKKEVRNKIHFFHADKHQRFYKLVLLFWWKWPDMYKVPEKGSWKYFCNILRRKKLSKMLLRSIVMQKIQIFYGVPVMFVVTCLKIIL